MSDAAMFLNAVDISIKVYMQYSVTIIIIKLSINCLKLWAYM